MAATEASTLGLGGNAGAGAGFPAQRDGKCLQGVGTGRSVTLSQHLGGNVKPWASLRGGMRKWHLARLQAQECKYTAKAWGLILQEVYTFL